MKALVIDRKRHPWNETVGYFLEDTPTPVLNEKKNPADSDHVLIKMKLAGICGTDRSIWHRKAFQESIAQTLQQEGKDTRIMGHELLGEVVEAGSRVEGTSGIVAGATVAAESHIICDMCYQCRQGQSNVCVNEKIIGISLDGCFAEYIKLPAKVLWPTDLNKIRPEVAAIQEPFGNAMHVCQKVDLRGRTVGVFGCGTIGMFAILIAKAFGAAKVIGIEPNPANAELARILGADEVIEFKPFTDDYKAHPDVVSQTRHLTNDLGLDVAFEMAGQNSSLNSAIHATRRGGDVILFGLQSQDWTIERMDKLIVAGIKMHSVIGRKIFATWYLTRGLLENSSNGIQDKIYKYILNQGQNTIIKLSEFDRDGMEKAMNEHPKLLLEI